MRWKLTRRVYGEDGIFGEISSENGIYTFQTLEHAYKVEDESHPGSVSYYPKIQEGRHQCVPYDSPKHGYVVPLLKGDENEGRFFEVHIGNYNEDSDGCILVGLSVGHKLKGGRMLMSSRQAFEQIMRLGVDEIEVVGV